MRRACLGVLVSSLLFGLIGCQSGGESTPPKSEIAQDQTVAVSTISTEPTKTVATATATIFIPTQTPVRVWSKEELQKNTVVFKQDTGFAVAKPFQGNKFTVEYNGAGLAYYVNFTQTTSLIEYRAAKIAAEKVFVSAGLTDLCSIRIFFVPPKALGNQPNVTDSVATGCSPYKD